MEVESGKLFIGGISWDTNEDCLREYFEMFGTVVEAVIMKDRTTGRARGFGFVVFANPAVADEVIKEKHIIDGRTVEAKKAVPRDDQHTPNRNIGSSHGSPGPARSKKIFVGGLASTVTEFDFKNYFDQFGTITDVVVMYDHNTQRPRGFGFITYDSEEAVDKVLSKTFHELNGKMVEVKRAVPKELSPGPSRSPLGGYNTGLNRVSNFLNAGLQGYNPNLMGGFGVRTDGRLNPITVNRSGYPPFSSSNYGMGSVMDLGLGSINGTSGNFGSSLSFGRGLNPLNGNLNRYGGQMGYGVTGGGTGSTLNSAARNAWGNSGNSYGFVGSGSANSGANSGSFGAFEGTRGLWNSSTIPGLGGENGLFSNTKFSYSNNAENGFASGGGYGRAGGIHDGVTSSYALRNDARDGAFENFYGDRPFNGNPTWRSLSPQLEGSGSFDYGHGNTNSDLTPSNSVGYVGGSVINRSNRGIAA